MNSKLHERNKIHFKQAHGTPFTIHPLAITIGDNGCTKTATTILDGKYLPFSIHPAARSILNECARVREPSTSTFPLHDMIKGLSHWREATSTSPSGKHLGFYKSLIIATKHNILAKEESLRNPSTKDTIASKLIQIQHLLINLAIKTCHTYERWKIVHNFFLEKLPGQPLLEKLRVIHIYEADWNLILKYFISHKLIHQAHLNGTLTPEQAGGRPGRSAIDEATKTVITYETCRLQRLNGGIIYNDAKACYDRIIENLRHITCMREGLSPSIARLHSQTLNQFQYFIKHKGGIGPIPNGHNKPDPFYGVGQGSGDAGAR
jgi:hypothetical protein